MYHVPNDTLVINKGQKVMIPIHSLHYNPKYFNDPELFDPERFSIKEKAKRPSGVYFPFGDGPRMCIGMYNGFSFLFLNTVLDIFVICICFCSKTFC